ncbi:DUF2339 domain-containing protein [Oryzibacter oryziterrae]|uniref:DUF2339 domain-containing protein n=1 Tax=Oryzibacter oryziterrae TaxID=2766474 RepID=UPI001F32AE00|nr:DUF2339 domain-containing protein [Oryzibacter oryziterrae]
MDDILALAALAALILVIGALLGFVAFIRTSSLSARLTVAEVELTRLRRQLAAGVVIKGQAQQDAPIPAADLAESETEVAPEPVAAPDHIATPEAAIPTATAQNDSVSSKPPKPKASLEETIGTRWAVWVGGLALGLGGIFLVRYSIEAGLLGPAARIALGLLFALALLGGGEALRRSGFADGPTENQRRAYVPGVLTAAGIVAAFADVYAAYALYDFIGTFVAFAALALIALATLALALLHGPALAALGLAASYATPLLVSSNAPAIAALAVYLLIVTAATLAVARLRSWRWLAITATVGAAVWALLMLAEATFGDQLSVALYISAATALTAYVFVASIHPRNRSADAKHDVIAMLCVTLFALPVLIFQEAYAEGMLAPVLLGAYGLALLALASEWPAVRTLAVTATLATVLGYAAFALPYEVLVDATTAASGDPIAPGLPEFLRSTASSRFHGMGIFLGLAFAAAGLAGAIFARGRSWLAAAGAMTPLGLLVVAYVRTDYLTPSPAFSLLGLILAFYLGSVTEYLLRRLPETTPSRDGAIALNAIGAIGALGAAAAFVLERGALTIVLALMVPAIAWVESYRPVKALRFTSALLALAVSLRIAADPSIGGPDLGTTPIFNWLLYGYGVPAASFAFAAWRFGKTRDDGFWVPVFEALAVIYTTLTVVMEIHHGMNHGDVFAGVSGLAEQSLLTMSFLAVSFGLHWLNIRRNSVVFGKGSLALGGLGLLASAIGLIVLENPLLTGEYIIGGSFDGTLLLGYLFPAIMLFIARWLASKRPDKPERYISACGWLGGVLAGIWVTLAVRAGWHSGDLSWGDPEEAELYAYSAAWLLSGLIVLAAGVAGASRNLRKVAAAIVIVVVAKVFLIDTAGLTGALRALSFIGLGIVLVGVGLAYQKFLRGQVTAPPPPPAP